jgi:PHD/YefM family antitoxin component YafN of YafNO toxin-antitoxin module
MPAERFVGADELQSNPRDLLEDITTFGTTCYITEDGKAKAVLMDINRYNALMDLVEEAESPQKQEEAHETREYASVRTILKNSTRFLSGKK